MSLRNFLEIEAKLDYRKGITLDRFMKRPFRDYTFFIENVVEEIKKDEERAQQQEAAQRKQQESVKMPPMPNYQMPKMPRY